MAVLGAEHPLAPAREPVRDVQPLLAVGVAAPRLRRPLPLAPFRRGASPGGRGRPPLARRGGRRAG